MISRCIPLSVKYLSRTGILRNIHRFSQKPNRKLKQNKLQPGKLPLQENEPTIEKPPPLWEPFQIPKETPKMIILWLKIMIVPFILAAIASFFHSKDTPPLQSFSKNLPLEKEKEASEEEMAALSSELNDGNSEKDVLFVLYSPETGTTSALWNWIIEKRKSEVVYYWDVKREISEVSDLTSSKWFSLKEWMKRNKRTHVTLVVDNIEVLNDGEEKPLNLMTNGQIPFDRDYTDFELITKLRLLKKAHNVSIIIVTASQLFYQKVMSFEEENLASLEAYDKAVKEDASILSQ